MKIRLFFFTTLLLIATILSNSAAEDNRHDGLPENTIARLGKGGVNIMRFSPDGTRLVVGTDVGLWVYNLTDSTETSLSTGYTGRINALAFSADGKTLASGGYNNPVIKLWEMETSTQLTTIPFTDLSNSVKALAFHKDKLIGIDTFDRIIHWNLNTDRNMEIVNRFTAFGTAVAFAKKGHIFASADHNGTIHLWLAASGEKYATLGKQPGFLEKFIENLVGKPKARAISALAFSPDAKILATGSIDKTVQVWDTEKQKKLGDIEGHNGWITAVAVSEDGKTLATGDTDKVIKLWDIDTQQQRATLSGHTHGIATLTFSPDGKTLASSSYDGTIRFYNQENGQEIEILTAGHTESIKTVAFSEDGATLTSAAFNGTVGIWSLQTHQELINFTNAQSDIAEVLVLSPNGRLLANRGQTRRLAFNTYDTRRRSEFIKRRPIQFWDIVTGEQLFTSQSEEKIGHIAVAFSADGKVAMAYHNFQEIQIWDTRTQEKLLSLKTRGTFPERKLHFSPNGSLLATYGDFVPTQVWDIAAQRELTPFTTGKDWTHSLAFSPDGTSLATKHSFGIVLSEITSTNIAEKHIIHSDNVSSVAANITGIDDVLRFSPDGKFLIAPKRKSPGYGIQISEVETGSSLETVAGHAEPIRTLSFSPDGKTLASGSQDGTVLLWDYQKIVAQQGKEKGEKILWKNDPEIVKNYLQQHNYQFKPERGRYILRDTEGNEGSIGTDGMGSTGSGDVRITHYGKGYFRLSIKHVGTGNFIFDKHGTLQSVDPSDFEIRN